MIQALNMLDADKEDVAHVLSKVDEGDLKVTQSVLDLCEKFPDLLK